MFRLPSASERVAIVGMTGSGKTVGGIWLLANLVTPKSKWIILDFKGDGLIRDIPEIKEIALDAKMPKHPGIYVVRPRPDQKDEVEAFLWNVWELGDVGLFVDEGYMLQRSKAFEAILTQGRSKRIPVITLSQRPAWISRFVWSESNFHQIFHVSLADDRKTIREFVPSYDPDIDLPEFHSLWHDVAARKPKPSIYLLTPAPDEATILNRFSERMGVRPTFI